MTATILVVEDEPGIQEVLQFNLGLHGHNVVTASSAEEAQAILRDAMPDLILLDWMLPGMSGIELAKLLRADARLKAVPIIMLTARAEERDTVLGLETGADDYITKPFSLEELFCRIEVFLRRGKSTPDTEKIITLGNYRFDYSNFRLANHQSERTLTSREAGVLRLLYIHRDRVLKREEILKTVWGDDDYFLGRSMDVFISRLRKYLKDDPNVQIVNYHGVGFKLELN
jgi:DNA-binding response OmpR family regulator